MQNFRTPGSWFSYLMVVLFFLLLATASLSLIGINETLTTALHRGAGIIFCILFLIHLVSTGLHVIVCSRKKYTLGTTTYHILHRQHHSLNH